MNARDSSPLWNAALAIFFAALCYVQHEAHPWVAAINAVACAAALALLARAIRRRRRAPRRAAGEALRAIALSHAGIVPRAGETDEELRARATEAIRRPPPRRGAAWPP